MTSVLTKLIVIYVIIETCYQICIPFKSLVYFFYLLCCIIVMVPVTFDVPSLIFQITSLTTLVLMLEFLS